MAERFSKQKQQARQPQKVQPQQNPEDSSLQQDIAMTSALQDFQRHDKPLSSNNVVNLQRYLGNQGIQRLLAQQNGSPIARQIQRSADHTNGCGCPACSGRISRKEDDEIQAMRPTIQRADEHDEDIQAKRMTIQRADEHDEDIQAMRLIQREDGDDAAKTVAERLVELKKRSLKTKFRKVFAEFNTVALSDLQPYIDAASNSEKKRVWRSKTLMPIIEAKMSDSDYLNLLPALGMFKKGRTAEDKKSHTRADKADQYIRQYLGDNVEEAVQRGASVEGQVAVVSGSDWLKAYENEFGDDGEEDITNAFVDDEGRIWVHKNRGNAGTIIHEGVHKYATDDFLSTVGFDFNEGITEYFTRIVCDQLKYDRGNYQDNWEFSKKFVDFMGEGLVSEAYFNGAVDELKDAFVAKGQDWDTLLGHTQAEEWGDAEAMLVNNAGNDVAPAEDN